MREILFRGKQKDADILLVGDLRQWSETKKGICDHILKKTFEVIPETLGEYSGVDDNNGIKLYEGDLVEAKLREGNWQGFSWGVQKVVFKNGAFGLLNSKEDFTPFANFADRVEFIKKGTVFD